MVTVSVGPFTVQLNAVHVYTVIRMWYNLGPHSTLKILNDMRSFTSYRHNVG